MKYKGIIFDLDGVICSTDKYHYKAWKKIADQLEIPFNEEMNDKLRGVSRMDSLDLILQNGEKVYSNEDKQTLAEAKNLFYQKLLKQMSSKDLSEVVQNTLYALKRKGLLLGIGSSSKNTKLILERIGLLNFFDCISDGTMIERSKPDPEVFLKAAKLLKLLPAECLVVEDASAGAEAAYKGGFDCAGIKAAREYSHITYQLDHFEDLITYIEDEYE